jgi:type IV secretory pathway VirB4 component
MVTVREFNEWSGTDGISFLTTESRQLLSIPRSLESSHIMIMGDTGAGKSVLQRRLAANSSKMAHEATPRTSLRIVRDGFGNEPPAAPEW